MINRLYRSSFGFAFLLAALYAFAIAYAILVCIWAWHLLTPASWAFVPFADFTTLESFLIGSAIALILSHCLR